MRATGHVGTVDRASPAGGEEAVDERVHARVLSAPSISSALDPGALEGIVRDLAPLLSPEEVADVAARVRARSTGLGVLEPLLADDSVTEIMINGPGPVWVERRGRLTRSGVTVDPATVEQLVVRVLAPVEARADRLKPLADARLGDGSRVHVVVPPLAVDGPYISIRRFAVRPVPLSAFAPEPVTRLLIDAVSARRHVVVCGGAGAGKTTLLNALAAHIPGDERVITIEDAAELRLPGEHVVRLEARPASAEGTGAVTIRDLLRAALRMRPDRIVVGEVRGAEALDMVQAMNTGHDGSLSTCHANGPSDALRRLEMMAITAGELPLPAIRDHLASAIDVIVTVRRDTGGRRRVEMVAEVDPDPDSPVRTRPVADGDRVLGSFDRPPRRPERADGGERR